MDGWMEKKMTYLLGWLGRNVECIALSVGIQHKLTDGYLILVVRCLSVLYWTGPEGYIQPINLSSSSSFSSRYPSRLARSFGRPEKTKDKDKKISIRVDVDNVDNVDKILILI